MLVFLAVLADDEREALRRGGDVLGSGGSGICGDWVAGTAGYLTGSDLKADIAAADHGDGQESMDEAGVTGVVFKLLLLLLLALWVLELVAVVSAVGTMLAMVLAVSMLSLLASVSVRLCCCLCLSLFLRMDLVGEMVAFFEDVDLAGEGSAGEGCVTDAVGLLPSVPAAGPYKTGELVASFTVGLPGLEVLRLRFCGCDTFAVSPSTFSGGSLANLEYLHVRPLLSGESIADDASVTDIAGLFPRASGDDGAHKSGESVTSFTTGF